MKITEYRYHDRYDTKKAHVIVETKCASVVEAGRAFVADLAEFNKRQKEFRQAEAEPARLKAQASEAAKTGTSAAEAKKILKKARAAQEGLEDLEIDYDVAGAKLAASRSAYLATVEEHVAELEGEARASAEAALLTLTTGAKMTRDGSATLADALATMNGLRGVRDGDEFTPKAPKAKKTTGDGFALNGVPEVHVSVGLEAIGTGIDFGQRILREFAAEAKARALVEGLEAEADDPAADIDDEPDEDDDDDFDEFQDES